MSIGLKDLDEMRLRDRERITEYLKTQPPMTRESWLRQVREFEAAGRDTASALPFWKRWLWKNR
jgi:hypothetical protein